MSTKSTYNLARLIAQTADIELRNPIDDTGTGIILKMLPTDSPKISPKLAEIFGTLPNFPSDKATFGEVYAYQQADKVATRKVMALRVVSANHEALATPGLIEAFFSECDYKIIEQLQEDSANRAIYFR